ncbi:hypothetical protein THAOC_12345, partial [Thalassiosira oceanica]
MSLQKWDSAFFNPKTEPPPVPVVVPPRRPRHQVREPRPFGRLDAGPDPLDHRRSTGGDRRVQAVPERERPDEDADLVGESPERLAIDPRPVEPETVPPVGTAVGGERRRLPRGGHRRRGRGWVAHLRLPAQAGEERTLAAEVLRERRVEPHVLQEREEEQGPGDAGPLQGALLFGGGLAKVALSISHTHTHTQKGGGDRHRPDRPGEVHLHDPGPQPPLLPPRRGQGQVRRLGHTAQPSEGGEDERRQHRPRRQVGGRGAGGGVTGTSPAASHHRSQAGSDEYQPTIVYNTLRPRTRAVVYDGADGSNGRAAASRTSSARPARSRSRSRSCPGWSEHHRHSPASDAVARHPSPSSAADASMA